MTGQLVVSQLVVSQLRVSLLAGVRRAFGQLSAAVSGIYRAVRSYAVDESRDLAVGIADDAH